MKKALHLKAKHSFGQIQFIVTLTYLAGLFFVLPVMAQLVEPTVERQSVKTASADSQSVVESIQERHPHLFGKNVISFTSIIDGRTYDAVVQNGSVSFFREDVQVQSVPADIFSRAGNFYHKATTPNPSFALASVDDQAGTFTASGATSGSLIDLMLGAVSVLFALAFLTTGFFLLRVARQRRIVGESRMRQQRAREAERTHLAAELHDGPVQDLQHVMRSYFGALTDAASKSATQILDIQSKLENVTKALRNICTELRPPVLAHFGLAYAVRSHADKFEQRVPDTNVHVVVTEADELEDEQLSLAYYRIFQESLTNIEKHAHASNVTVTLQIDARWVELVIQDDGIGFETPRRLEDLEEDGHLGLSGLAQRAEAVGGVFEVRSVPGSGTTIRVVARKLSRDERGAVGASLEVA